MSPERSPKAAVDGVWVDDRWYFGGAETTVHQRNLSANQQIVVHLPDPMAAVIVEGTTRVKCAKHGYPAKADDYLGGVWCLRPSVVLAWEQLHMDATRFVF